MYLHRSKGNSRDGADTVEFAKSKRVVGYRSSEAVAAPDGRDSNMLGLGPRLHDLETSNRHLESSRALKSVYVYLSL